MPTASWLCHARTLGTWPPVRLFEPQKRSPYFQQMPRRSPSHPCVFTVRSSRQISIAPGTDVPTLDFNSTVAVTRNGHKYLLWLGVAHLRQPSSVQSSSDSAVFDAVDLRDVGMIQGGQQLGFALASDQLATWPARVYSSSDVIPTCPQNCRDR